LLIDQRGADAVLNAAGPVLNLLLEDGDAEGAAVWRAIVRVIEELQRERGSLLRSCDGQTGFH
jgi:hypothetical protein